MRTKAAVNKDIKLLKSEIDTLNKVDVSKLTDAELNEHNQSLGILKSKMNELLKELSEIQKSLDDKKASNSKTYEVGKYEVNRFELKKDEKHLVHLRVVRPGFNQDTGEPLHKPYIYTCNEKEYKMFEKNKTGLKVLEELHIPK